MGYYIETGSAFCKAEHIMLRHGAIELDPAPKYFTDVPANMALICVVDNGFFEAAGYCYNPQEFAAFTDPNDPRPKRWLVMDKALACKLTGYKF